MAMNQFGAGFTIFGRDAASPVFARVAGRFMGMVKTVVGGAATMSSSLGAMAIGMKARQIGKAMTGSITAMSDAAATFEQNLAGIGVITGATAKEMKGLHDAALDAAMATQFSPEEATEGLQNLAAAGLSAGEAVEALKPVLDLATGSLGQLGLAEAGNAVVGTLKAFGMEASNAAVVTDKLLKITQLTNFQARDFDVGLSRAASTAKIYGQNLDDTLITMGALRNMNVEASVASTSLREAWRRMASDQRAQQLITRKGIDIFDKRTGKAREFIDVMFDVADATKKMTDKERMRMATLAFGTRGMAAFNAIAQAQKTITVNGVKHNLKGRKAIAALRLEMMHATDAMSDFKRESLEAQIGIEGVGEALQGSTGAAEKFREELLDTLKGQRKLIEGAKEGLLTVLGEAAAKVLKPLSKVVYTIISGIAGFLNTIPMEARQVIIAFIGGLGTLISMVGGLFILKGIMSMLGVSIGGLVFALVKFVLVLAPLTILLAGLGVAAYAAFRAFKKNTGGIGDSWEDMVKKIKLGWRAVVQIIGKGELSKKMNKELSKAGNEGVLGFVNGFKRFVERMKAMWEGIKRGFDEGVAALSESSAMKQLIATMQTLFGTFTGDAENSAAVLADWGEKGEGLGKKLASFGEIALKALNHFIKFGKKAVEWMANLTAEDVINGLHEIAEVFKTIWTVLKKIGQTVAVVYHAIRVLVLFVKNTIGGMVSNFGDMWTGLFGDEAESKAAKKRILYRQLRGVEGAYGETGRAGVDLGEAGAKLFGKEDEYAETAALSRAQLERQRRTGAMKEMFFRMKAGDEISPDLLSAAMGRDIVKAIKDAKFSVKVNASELRGALKSDAQEDAETSLDTDIPVSEFGGY